MYEAVDYGLDLCTSMGDCGGAERMDRTGFSTPEVDALL